MRLIASNVLIPSPSTVIGEGLGVPEVSHGAHMADRTERRVPAVSQQDENRSRGGTVVRAAYRLKRFDPLALHSHRRGVGGT